MERAIAGDVYDDRDLVFAREAGAITSPTELSRMFPKLRREAGIPTGSLHVMRHTFATLALTKGVPVHVVAARLGDDPATVLQPMRTSSEFGMSLLRGGSPGCSRTLP